MTHMGIGEARARAMQLAFYRRRAASAPMATAASFAKHLNVSKQLVSAVIRGKLRSKKVEEALTRDFPEEIAAYPFPPPKRVREKLNVVNDNSRIDE